MAPAAGVVHDEDFDQLWDPISRGASMHSSVSEQVRDNPPMDLEQVTATYHIIAAAATPATAVADGPSFGE